MFVWKNFFLKAIEILFQNHEVQASQLASQILRYILVIASQQTAVNQSINIFQGKTQTGQFTNLNKHISILHDILLIIVIMKTLEPFEKIKGSSYIVAVFRQHVADLSFMVTRTHQKIKALFCCIDFDYKKNLVKKCFVFFQLFSFEYKKRKEKYTLYSIMLQNLL